MCAFAFELIVISYGQTNSGHRCSFPWHWRGRDGVKGCAPRSSSFVSRRPTGHASDVDRPGGGRVVRVPRFLHAVLGLDSSSRHGELIKKLLTETAPGGQAGSRLGDDDVDGDGDDGRSFVAGCAGMPVRACVQWSVRSAAES